MKDANKKLKNVKYIHNITASSYKEYFGEEWDNKKHIDKFIEILKSNNVYAKVLELGCGWGYHTDQKTKNRLWRFGDKMFYKKGVTDPDYCVLKFTAEEAEYYCDLKIEKIKF